MITKRKDTKRKDMNTKRTNTKRTNKRINTKSKRTKKTKTKNNNNSKEKEQEKDDTDIEAQDEIDDLEEEDIKKLIDKIGIDDILYEPKKGQFKQFLNNLTEKSFKLLKNDKYESVIKELNNEYIKTDVPYLKNEILKIIENIKYEYYKDPKHNDDSLNYPTYYDPNFGQKIFKKAEFYKNKLNKIKPIDVDKIIAERKSGNISLANHQRFLKIFMSSNTPYKGALIYHGLGVGKTCASIVIAETLKESVLKHNQKIIIIHKPNFDKGEIFDIEKLKKGQNQCAGDTYISNDDPKNKDLVKKCQDGNNESCKIIKYKVDKAIKNTYNFYGALEWAKFVIKDLKKATRGVPEDKIKEVEIKRIKNMYSNTVMIIDEAHNIKEQGESKSKFVPPILMKVLEYAENLKLVLLTGTPMFNEPSDLISLLNYLLINDKRPILRDSDIFKQDGTFTANGKTILENYSRGYVSFMRSEDPIKFPIRLSPSINNGSSGIITSDKYPKKNIYGKPLSLDDKIKHLEIIGCPMNKEQEKVYNSYINKRITPEDDKTSAAYSSELQILNFIYQDLDDNNLSETYGEKGLNSVMTKIGNKQQYKFNNPDDALSMKGDALKEHSSKIHKIMENIEKANGLVFVYTEYITSGVLPMAFALELAGYKKYKSSDTPILVSDHKDKKYKGDYLIISGNASDYESYLEKKNKMIDEPVKVIIASRTASEGINLFGVREMHILNPWHNLNRLSQAIGRGLRTWSHIDLPKEERNITVYLYAATFKNNEKETVDLKIYREAEAKAINIGDVETVLRRNAIDCALNKEGNEYLEKDWGDKITIKTSRGEIKKVNIYDQEYSQICHFKKDCDFKCYNPPPKINLKEDELDYSTYNFDSLKYEIDELIKIIGKLFKSNVLLTLDEIISKLDTKYNQDKKLIYKALDVMIKKKSEVIDKFGRPGYLLYRGNYYIYQPLEINNEELMIYQRGVPPPIRPNMIDLSEYVIKLSEEKKKMVKKEQYNIDDVLLYIDNYFNNIKNKTINDVFLSNLTLNNDEIYQIIIDRLIVPFKRVLLNYLLLKVINNNKLNPLENSLFDCLQQNIIYKGYIEHNKDKSIVGYRLIENDKQIFYKYNSSNNSFENNINLELQVLDIQKIKYANLKTSDKDNNVYGYLKFDKMDQPAQFKIKDLSKGEKKSIKGITCVYMSRGEIYKHLKTLDNKSKEVTNKKMMCDDIEVIMRRNDMNKKDGKRWFYSVEEAKEIEDNVK